MEHRPAVPRVDGALTRLRRGRGQLARGYQGPKVRAAVAVTVSHRAARSMFLTSARQRRVSAVRAGSLGRPRLGTGVRYGASVSARMSSAGAAAAASRSGWALANV